MPVEPEPLPVDPLPLGSVPVDPVPSWVLGSVGLDSATGPALAVCCGHARWPTPIPTPAATTINVATRKAGIRCDVRADGVTGAT